MYDINLVLNVNSSLFNAYLLINRWAIQKHIIGSIID
jgi:hypothetical protein